MVIVALVVVLALVAVGAAVVLLRRRDAGEVESVAGYRHTLETLQDIRTRSERGTVRLVGGETPPPATPSAPAAPEDRPLVFDDAQADGHPARPMPGRPGGRVERRAMSAMNHRPRRLLAPVLVAVAVVALLVAVIVIGARAGHGGGHPSASSPTTTHVTTTTVVHRTKPTTSSTTASTTSSTTSTTNPAGYTAVTSTQTTATYTAPASSYTLGVATTSAPCWVQISSGATTVFSQTIQPGQSQTVPASGTMTVVLGAPSAVQVTMNGKPVVLPDGYQTPFDITIQAPA